MMIPAKNRDRKCSTCRHYQPSPLWRKGWCRNPLLYDRNTNHLVEADSLACNRTFIDYWEPVAGPTQPVGPQARNAKPRIAPSIPVNTTDPKGKRSVVTGNTPAGGMAAYVPSDEAEDPPRSSEPPRLSLVGSGYVPMEVEPVDAPSKVTRLIEQVPAPSARSAATDEAPSVNAAERIRQARAQRRKQYFSSTRGRIMILLLALVLLAAAGVGATLLSRATKSPVIAAQFTPVATQPLPTPTGLGDATATPAVPPTAAVAQPPPPGQIAVQGWVQVQAAGGLTLRDAPSLTGKRLQLLRNGVKAHVVDGPKDADGHTWWKVDSFDAANPSASGWCSGKFLVASTAPAP